MAKLLSMGLVLGGLCVANVSAAGGPDAVTRELIATMNQLSAIMESIRDDVSASAVLPKLTKVAERAGALRRQMDSYKLSPEEKRKLQEKYQKDADAARSRMSRATLQAIQKAPKKRGELFAALRKAVVGKR